MMPFVWVIPAREPKSGSSFHISSIWAGLFALQHMWSHCGLQNWNEHLHLSTQSRVAVAFLEGYRCCLVGTVTRGHPIWWAFFFGLRNLHVVRQLVCFSVSVQFELFILHVTFTGNIVLSLRGFFWFLSFLAFFCFCSFQRLLWTLYQLLHKLCQQSCQVCFAAN